MPISTTANVYGRVKNLVYTTAQWESTYSNVVLKLGEIGIEALVDDLSDIDQIFYGSLGENGEIIYHGYARNNMYSPTPFVEKIGFGYVDGTTGKKYYYGFSDDDYYGAYHNGESLFRMKIGDGVSTWDELPYYDNYEISTKIVRQDSSIASTVAALAAANQTIANMQTAMDGLEARIYALEHPGEGDTIYVYGPDRIRQLDE